MVATQGLPGSTASGPEVRTACGPLALAAGARTRPATRKHDQFACHDPCTRRRGRAVPESPPQPDPRRSRRERAAPGRRPARIARTPRCRRPMRRDPGATGWPVEHAGERRASACRRYTDRSARGQSSGARPVHPSSSYGETGPRVAQVIIRYAGPHGCRRTPHATLARATDRRSLSAAGIRRPFGYFVATVPGRVRNARADARSGSGHLLGSANFSRLLADGRPTTVFLQGAEPWRPGTRPGPRGPRAGPSSAASASSRGPGRPGPSACRAQA